MLRWLVMPVILAAAPAAAAQEAGAAARITAAVAEAEEAVDRRRWRQARNSLGEAADAYQALRTAYPLLEARIEGGWTDYYRAYERWDDAADHGRRALTLFVEGEAGDREIGDAAYDLGYVAYRARQFTDAQAAFFEAVNRYRTALPAESSRRWRANGWHELASLAHDHHGGDANDDVTSLNNTSAARLTDIPDHDLAEWIPNEVWAESPPVIFLPSNFVGENDGFVVIRFTIGEDGRTRDIEIMSSHPGDLYVEGVEYGVERGRADPARLTPGQRYGFVFTVVQE